MESYIPRVVIWYCKKCGGRSYEFMDVPDDCTSWEYYSLFYIQLPHFKCNHCGATESQRFPRPKPAKQTSMEKKDIKETTTTEKSHNDALWDIRRKNLYRSH